MLTNPPLLFCDEPTSGLDSFMAQSIVQTLQNMASKNHTVMCTIHQPSSEVFALFDRVLLMAEGRVAFMGSCADAMKFFNNMNYVCPTNFNPADFFVLTLAIVPGQEDECRRKVHAICDGFADSSDAKEITQSIKDVYEASWGSQFLTVLWRSWIAGVRDVFLFRVRVMQTLIVALVIGLIYLQLDYDQKGVMDINGGIFMLVANTTMSFPVEITLFLREYGSGLYRSDIYYIAKSIAELPTFIVLPIVSMTIDYWMMGLYNSAEAYLVAIGVSVLIANVSMSFGHVVSTLTGSVNIALAIAPPVVIPFMMFGGFFLNTDYSNELLVVNQWENVDSIECAFNATAVAASQRCLFLDGDSVIDYLSFSPDNRWLNVGLMFALLVGFRILAFIFLLIRARLAKS
ncbi:hypothetical protein BaRGS_00001349 [Batillaria attramentaria]|uniref:Uncharacterized protein n=1 Tax=Batillaria attramentaria TaxID=370345 RepID=A0ABD0M7Q8_9CAEN